MPKTAADPAKTKRGSSGHRLNSETGRKAIEARWARERADPSIATARAVRALVACAPALTDDQRSRLAALLAAPRPPATEENQS